MPGVVAQLGIIVVAKDHVAQLAISVFDPKLSHGSTKRHEFGRDRSVLGGYRRYVERLERNYCAVM